MERRSGDKIFIEGGYQHHALLHGHRTQRAWHHLKLRTAMELASLKEGARILDAGCGSGVLTQYLPSFATSYTGIDANSDAVEFATHTYGRPGVCFRQLLVDETDRLREKDFDRIFFLEIIEHITQAQGIASLEHFHRLLVPGGQCIISTPNRKSLWPAIEWTLDLLKRVPALKGEQHEHIYSIDELRAAAKSAGFKIREVRTINAIAPWMAFAGMRVTEIIHRLELSSSVIPGSLILALLEKE